MPRMNNKRWLAGLAMSVLSNPNADREAINNARETIYELLEAGSRDVRIPQFSAVDKFTGEQFKPKRKLSAWQKYIKNPRNQIKYTRGTNYYKKGQLNLKAMGVQYRKKKRR